jgi:hypothetical protein
VAATFVAASSPAQAATVQAAWNMDRLPTMVDSAGGDNNGTTRNVTLYGGTYGFNGVNSFATAPDRPNLDPGAASITLSARIAINQVPRVGQTFDVIRKGTVTTAGGYYKMEIMRSGSGAAIAACRFKDSNGRSGEAYGTVNLAGRGFVPVTCTKTSTGVTVNAAGQASTAPKTLGPISNAAPVYVGQKGDGTDWFPGLMDFVKIATG